MDTTLHIGPVAIPPMALGTMYLGTLVPADEADACLDSAFEAGARFWDTANNYAFWAGGVGDESEETIGHWLAEHGPRSREQVVLATKVGARPAHPGGDLNDALGLSRAAVRAQVDACLRRLRTDHVDVLYAHVDDREVPLAETLGVLGELVEEGRARAVAASNLTADRLRGALAVPADHGYAALQQRFTYLAPAEGADLSPHVLLDDQIAALCTANDVTMLGYSPLLSGAYTRAERAVPDGYDVDPETLRRLRQTADEHGLDAGQTVLSWMVHRREPVVPVVGVSRPEQVRSAWQAVHTDLDVEACRVLDEARGSSTPG